MNRNSNLNRTEYSDNFVKKVLKECTRRKISISETIVSHVVGVMKNIPGLKIEVDGSSTDLSYLENKLMSACAKICQSDSPALLTLKLQSEIKLLLSTKNEIVMDHRSSIQKLTQPLLSELTARNIRISERIDLEKDEIEGLYQKLVITITLLSGLGNPTQKPILMSATVALSSVFPISEIASFLSLAEPDKIKQIEDLAHIVAGIRIFNHFTHNHSEGIDDLPNILRPACVALREAVISDMEENKRRQSLLDNSIHSNYMMEPEYKNGEFACTFYASDGTILPNYEFMRDIIIARTQMNICLRQLLQEVENSELCLQEFEKGLKQQIEELVEVTANKTCIPTDVVFPGFLQLSTIWCVLQDQVIILNHFNNILNFLRSSIKVHVEDEEMVLSVETRKESTLSESEGCLTFLDEGDKKSLIESMKKSHLMPRFDDHIISTDIHNCQVIPFMDETCLPTIEFRNSCVFKLMMMDGFITPGNLKIGFLRYDSKYYAFSSSWAAYEFDKDPELFLAHLMEVICKHPELILIFDMKIEDLRKINSRRLPSLEREGKENFEMQTGPVESYFDKDYTWNVWDFKRKAIQLADIRNMQTHSTQTKASNRRRSIAVQTYKTKDAGTQTRTNRSTMIPKFLNFRFYLNGDGEYDENIYKAASKIISEREEIGNEIFQNIN